MKSLKIKIIVADYYTEITNSLTKSCIDILEKNNLKYEIINVPGVYEIPQMIKWKIKPNNYNLFIALGCVIKGETYHFEVISDSVGNALLDIVTQNKSTLISNGIINAYSKSQAIKRSKSKNKGKEAANAMVKMIECLI
ncbi:6,7-dimethyl-8-ribityllumazine synthase [Alphaproteobacteria bacterium]|nr:6,7-dimethyl-8-ribityllumazine synthase [Alphaproteobacteria bacterium]